MKFCARIILDLLFINDGSILVFLREIHISTNALKLHMSDMDVDLD